MFSRRFGGGATTGGDLAESVRFASGVAALNAHVPVDELGSLTVIKPDLLSLFV